MSSVRRGTNYMQPLKQSTAATRLIGPVLDSVGVAYTGAVIGDFNITKNGTTAAMASAASATHSHEGHYLLAFTTGNTDTLGELSVSCNKSTYAMPVSRWTVLTSGMFDALVTNGNVSTLTAVGLLDTALSGHTTSGTVGGALSDAGSAGDPLENELGGYASGTAGAALARVGTGTITVRSPIDTDGRLTIIRGDDYRTADGWALEWTDTENIWPSLTGTTPTLTIQGTAFSGTVVDANTVRVELTSTQTTALTKTTVPTGRYYLRIADSHGHTITLASGTARVKDPGDA